MNKSKIENKIGVFLIILITLAAIGARVIGLSYDNLICYNHDEQIHLLTAEKIFHGELNPREIWEGRKFLYIFYPWLSMYIVAGIYYLYDLILSCYSSIAVWLIYLAGAGGSLVRDFSFPSRGFDSRHALYMGRLIVALIGAANIPLLFLIGKRLWDRRVGLLAAAFLALNGYHVANCHWMKNDIIATFFLAVAFLFSIRIFSLRKLSDYILAAVFSAAAINTKSYTAPILATCLFAHLSTFSSLTFRSFFRALITRKFVVFVIVFLLIFIITYPLFYLDFNYIISNFQKVAEKTETDAMFGGLGNKARPRTLLEIRWDNICNFARFSWEMEAGLGGYVLLLGVGGIITSLLTRKKRLLLLVSFPLLFLISAVLVASPGIRYQDIIPLIPFFALLAAVFIRFIGKIVFKKNWLVTVTVLILGIAVLIPYIRMVIRMDYGYWERSIRYFATRWVARNIPPGSTVIRESKTLSLNDSRYHSARVRALWDRDINGLKSAGVDYLIVAQRHEARALEETGLFGPEHPYGRFYLSLPDHYDLIKEFNLGVIPYRGGGSKIWELRKEYPFSPRSINSAFLRRIQDDFSFSSPEILFPDQSGRCEGTTGYIISPDDKEGRLLVSPVPIPRLGIQVRNGSQAGRIRIRYGTEKITEDFQPGQVRQFVISPSSGFPFIDYSYRINVSAPWNTPCRARIQTNSLRIGLGYYEMKDYAEAIPFLEEACRLSQDDWYPHVLLAIAYNLIREEEKADFYFNQAEKVFPEFFTALKTLGDDRLSMDQWKNEFEKWTGFTVEWIAQRTGRSWIQDDWIETSSDSDNSRIELGEFYLPEGYYRIMLRRFSWDEKESLTGLLYLEGNLIGGWSCYPGDEGMDSYEFENRSLSNKYTLIVEGSADLLSNLDDILIYPTVDSIRLRIDSYIDEILEQFPGSQSE